MLLTGDRGVSQTTPLERALGRTGLKGHAHDYARARGYSSMTDLDEITGTTLSLSLPGDVETTIDGVR